MSCIQKQTLLLLMGSRKSLSIYNRIWSRWLPVSGAIIQESKPGISVTLCFWLIWVLPPKSQWHKKWKETFKGFWIWVKLAYVRTPLENKLCHSGPQRLKYDFFHLIFMSFYNVKQGHQTLEVFFKKVPKSFEYGEKCYAEYEFLAFVEHVEFGLERMTAFSIRNTW